MLQSAAYVMDHFKSKHFKLGCLHTYNYQGGFIQEFSLGGEGVGWGFLLEITKKLFRT